jgi:hypothetical protein
MRNEELGMGNCPVKFLIRNSSFLIPHCIYVLCFPMSPWFFFYALGQVLDPSYILTLFLFFVIFLSFVDDFLFRREDTIVRRGHAQPFRHLAIRRTAIAPSVA